MIVSIVATFFMSRDRRNRKIHTQFPVKWDDKLRIFKSDLFGIYRFYKGSTYLNAYNFLELLGYIILGRLCIFRHVSL